jgi:succinate dehydrogenase/fumarate reductase flavoprotein subunit
MAWFIDLLNWQDRSPFAPFGMFASSGDLVQLPAQESQDHPMVSRLAHETANMIFNAEMKLRAFLVRKEGCCSRHRLDYPNMDNDSRQVWISIYQGDDGTM